jgi:hypothetical protein
MQHPRRMGGATVVAVLFGLGVLAGCSSTHGAADSSGHPTTSSASTSVTTSTTTTSAATTATSPASAVLAAYRASWNSFEHALANANPSDPELTATMVDPQLEGVKANLLADQRQGIVGRGTFALHPKVTALTATTATVVDCAYSTSVLVYASTGKPVSPITPPENDGVQCCESRSKTAAGNGRNRQL